MYASHGHRKTLDPKTTEKMEVDIAAKETLSVAGHSAMKSEHIDDQTSQNFEEGRQIGSIFSKRQP